MKTFTQPTILYSLLYNSNLIRKLKLAQYHYPQLVNKFYDRINLLIIQHLTTTIRTTLYIIASPNKLNQPSQKGNHPRFHSSRYSQDYYNQNYPYYRLHQDQLNINPIANNINRNQIPVIGTNCNKNGSGHPRTHSLLTIIPQTTNVSAISDPSAAAAENKIDDENDSKQLTIDESPAALGTDSINQNDNNGTGSDRTIPPPISGLDPTTSIPVQASPQVSSLKNVNYWKKTPSPSNDVYINNQLEKSIRDNNNYRTWYTYTWNGDFFDQSMKKMNTNSFS